MPEMLTIKGMHVGEVIIDRPFEGLVHPDADLTFCRQMGVEYICSYLPLGRSARELSLEEESSWYYNRLAKFRGRVESFGQWMDDQLF